MLLVSVSVSVSVSFSFFLNKSAINPNPSVNENEIKIADIILGIIHFGAVGNLEVANVPNKHMPKVQTNV